MFKNFIAYVNYCLEIMKYRPVRYTLCQIGIKQGKIYIDYKTNASRASLLQRALLSDTLKLRGYFNRNDKLKLDFCSLIEELLQVMQGLPMASLAREKMFDEFYVYLSHYLPAKMLS